MAEDYRKDDNDFRFEIVKSFGVISTNSKGWKKELSLVKWNGRNAKYDIRDWSPDHSKMGRGITMNEAEFSKLTEIILSSNDTFSVSNSNLYEVQESMQELSA